MSFYVVQEMKCPTCDKFPARTSKFPKIACEPSRHGTLYRCTDCGQLIEVIDGERACRMLGFGVAFRHYMMSPIWPLNVSQLECKDCRKKIDLADAVLSSPFSWPQMQTFWHECSGCGTGNHIRIVKGLSSIIEIIGAPGPSWETVERCPTEGLDMNEDPEFLHVSIGDVHRAIPARK